MKKERNCNDGMTPYPIYQPYQPGMMMPGTMLQPNMTMPINPSYNYNVPNYQGQTSNTVEQQLNSLNNQINSLERRVSNLENLIGNTSNQYNTSNYQVM